MNRCFLFSLLVACALPHGASRADEMPELTAKDLSQFTPISVGVRHAASFTLYEGLPHQVVEADLLKRELATKKTIRLHGYPFYERPLPVAVDEIEALRGLCSAADSFWSYGGAKFCGGFHPDYCLAWKDGKATYELLICLGCHEMKLYGPKQELMADIRTEAYQQFKTLLKKHRGQRPKGE